MSIFVFPRTLLQFPPHKNNKTFLKISPFKNISPFILESLVFDSVYKQIVCLRAYCNYIKYSLPHRYASISFYSCIYHNLKSDEYTREISGKIIIEILSVSHLFSQLSKFRFELSRERKCKKINF